MQDQSTRRNPKYVPATCQTCGSTYQARRDRLAVHANHYCSIACKATAQRSRPPLPNADRFWPKVEKTSTCWLWTGATKANGYGHLTSAGGRHIDAHRMAWELTHGPIPAGVYVCHHCDTPRCVRPDHLYLGTPSDNYWDMAAKGRRRIAVGDARHPKLTEALVREARRRYAAGGVSIRGLARHYGVSASVMTGVLDRSRWAHVE